MTRKFSLPCRHVTGSSGIRFLAAMFILAVAMAGMTGPAHAQASVNIVYPINGATYPFTDPAPGPLKSAYFTASFSVTCKGDHKVEWGFDNTTVGTQGFYDQTSVQLVYKLPGGGHSFWAKVDKNCGGSGIKFKIGR